MDMLSGSPNKVKTLIRDERFKVILFIEAVATKKDTTLIIEVTKCEGIAAFANYNLN